MRYGKQSASRTIQAPHQRKRHEGFVTLDKGVPSDETIGIDVELVEGTA